MVNPVSALVGSDAADRSLAILRAIFGSTFAQRFSVELWDGTVVPARERERFTLIVAAPFGLRAAFSPPLDLGPGRAFVERWIDVRGDVEAAVDEMMTALGMLTPAKIAVLLVQSLLLPAPPPDRIARAARLRGRLHSRRRDAQAVKFHYDVPVDFYGAFLDEALVYSCAYFEDEGVPLSRAQEAKIDHTLRKVRLQPGETLLDIGCGWGALVMRAAQRYGARAVGITLSAEQHAHAVRRVAAAGLAQRVSIRCCDYRELGAETFDKVVSIGMVEHVGRERLSDYFGAAYRALRPGGLFLNHGIGQLNAEGGYRTSGFMERYVFPDGDLLPIADLTRAAERAGFELRDIENLREHYARTLRAWARRLDARRVDAIAATDERTYRTWRLYLAGSAQGFARGRMALYQMLLAKRDAAGQAHLPPTRHHLYASAAAGPILRYGSRLRAARRKRSAADVQDV